MLDDKQGRIRAIVPNLMGHESTSMPATYHAFLIRPLAFKPRMMAVPSTRAYTLISSGQIPLKLDQHSCSIPQHQSIGVGDCHSQTILPIIYHDPAKPAKQQAT
jgi:hypothetical protein